MWLGAQVCVIHVSGNACKKGNCSIVLLLKTGIWDSSLWLEVVPSTECHLVTVQSHTYSSVLVGTFQTSLILNASQQQLNNVYYGGVEKASRFPFGRYESPFYLCFKWWDALSLLQPQIHMMTTDALWEGVSTAVSKPLLTRCSFRIVSTKVLFSHHSRKELQLCMTFELFNSWFYILNVTI